jgi:hypothetical protein
MRDIELYNKYLDKKVFEIENPMGFHLPGHPAKVKMKVIGEKEYITGGNKVNFLTYEITVLPSGAINRLIDVLMDNKKYKELTTTTRILSELRWKCNEKLQSFLSLMGEDTPTISIGITNEYTKNMNESLIKESKHDTLVSVIVKDILNQLKLFNNSDEKEAQIDLPDEGEYYYTPFFYGETHSFYIELYLFKTNLEHYKIDADAPGDIEDNDIRVGIYYNPKLLKSQIQEIKNNLIYTLRHEYEHLLQVITDNERVTYSEKHRYKKDSLSTLLKQQEIEPQIRGYYLQSKKEKKPFEEVISAHLDKMQKNNQINFLSPERKQIVIDVLVDYAKKLNLPV